MSGSDISIVIVAYLGIMLLVGMMLLAGSFFLNPVLRCAREWSFQLLLGSQGIIGKARIADLDIDRKGRYSKYYVQYHFRENEQTHEQRQRVRRRNYRRLSEYDTVTIRYLLNTPTVSRLAEEDQDNSLKYAMTIVTFVTILFLPPMFIIWAITFVYYTAKYSSEEEKRGKRKLKKKRSEVPEQERERDCEDISTAADNDAITDPIYY